MESSNAGHEFKRIHARRKYGADIIFARDNKAHRGIIKNLSLGGAFIKSTQVNLFSKGDEITVSIPFTNDNKSIKRKGQIKWLNQEGFAIEFA